MSFRNPLDEAVHVQALELARYLEAGRVWPAGAWVRR